MMNGTLSIPDYQRDADQWSDATKSLFIESIINNLTIPAFFFESIVDSSDGIEKNEVVDGQQRLTTLLEFFKNKYRLVDQDSAPYLSPMSVHYAKCTFDELPPAYQQAFKRYRLTIIKLRNLGEVKLEVFRRINQGGTPLSGQDIRLAYYGDASQSVALVRAAGIYDPARASSKRILDGVTHQPAHVWGTPELETWKDYWNDKEVARGQTPSEMFLWAIVGSRFEKLNKLLTNRGALAVLKARFNGGIDEALDAACAQLQFQDRHPSTEEILPSYATLTNDFFPHFQAWFHRIVGREATSLGVNRYRTIAAVIGQTFVQRKRADAVTKNNGRVSLSSSKIRRRRPRSTSLPGHLDVDAGKEKAVTCRSSSLQKQS
ncbi:MAG: DUF262 domain-containing protein [Myxococcales bacterium]|nr:DUF262 domain-containing protein [Myxococcales bacterium]